MAVKRNYRINLRNYGNSPAIMVSQYDENYDLVFEVYDGVVPATGLNAYTVKLVGRQPGNDPALKYEFTGTVSGIANNILSFTIDTTMTGRAGKGTAEIVILDTTNDVKFASFNLPVYVEKAAVPDDAIDADVERAQEIAEEVQDIVDTAAAEVKGEAESWAVGQRDGEDVPSTDPTYHNNAKYYSEVAQDIADSIGIDATLSITGKAADAKKTGDEISSLKEDLNIGYITMPPTTNGSFGINGLTTGNSTRIRTDLIPVKIGDKIVIDNGTLKHACGAWKDSVSTANNVRNDISFNPLGESIISTINGYYVVVFTKQDDTQDISLSDFDGYVHVYSSGIYRNAESISKINSKLNDIIDKAYGNVSIGDIGTKIAGYSFGTSKVNVSGSPNASYDSYYFYTDKETAMYFASSAPSSPTYIALTVGYNPAKTWTIADSAGTMKMLCTSTTRKRKSENNLPVQASPMDVSDAIVIVTVNVNTTTSFNINSKLLLDADVALSASQVEQVISSIPEGKCPKLQYRSVSEWENEKSSEQVDVYLPTDNGYVRYAVGHSIDANTNANSWRILRALATDYTLTDRFAITTHGEWEMAVKINGGTDFIGGILHGDEVLDNIRFYVDGKAVTISTFTTVTNFSELRIVEFTDMYDPDAQTDKVAEHIKEYIFTADGLTLNQQIKWLMAKTLTTSYCCMFPLIRGNDTVSELQVTGKYYDNNDYKEYDVSVGGFEGYPATWHTGVTIAHLYASASGVFATAEMVKQPSLTGGDRSFLQNTTNQYNKLYYAICGIGSNCDVAVNDKWDVTSKYVISVT